jgi:hypothetical protein
VAEADGWAAPTVGPAPEGRTSEKHMVVLTFAHRSPYTSKTDISEIRDSIGRASLRRGAGSSVEPTKLKRQTCIGPSSADCRRGRNYEGVAPCRLRTPSASTTSPRSRS